MRGRLVIVWVQCRAVRGRCAIKRNVSLTVTVGLGAGLIVLALVLSACGGGEQVVATPFPTRALPTATPRSTALPLVSPAPAPGQGERAIVVQFVLPAASVTSTTRRVAIQLQRQLEIELELDFSVEMVDEQTALDGLCSGRPQIAWVSAFSYIYAEQQCGALPARAVQRGRPPGVTIGRTGDLIARRDILAPAQLEGQVFCRSRQQDLFTSWILPGLILGASGVDPLNDLSAVQDYPDDLTTLLALYRGQCASTGLAEGRLPDLLDELALQLSTPEVPITADDLAASIGVLVPAGAVSEPAQATDWDGFASHTVPYEVLVFPPDTALPPALREEILAQIDSFFGDRAAGSERLDALLGASAIMPVRPAHYAAFRALLTDSGWNMTYSD